jgi:hypothetical protein
MNTFITSDPKMYRFANNLVADMRHFYHKKKQFDQQPHVSFQGKQKSDMYVDIK